MVDAQYRLLSKGLGIHHARLIIGNSMGGMNAWRWSERYPDYMDTLVPDGFAADGDGEPQLGAAADDAGNHPQRS
jgi:homoserine acetyltransferase